MDSALSRISRTGFFASVCAYAVFWLADVLRPGFVARYLSIHLFLVPAVVFGWLWARQPGEWRDQAILWYLAGVPLGVLAAVMVWNVGAGFEDARVLAALLAALAPILTIHLIRSSTSD